MVQVDNGPTVGVHEIPDIFTKRREDLSTGIKATYHVYYLVITDSTTKRTFIGDLDASNKVIVYVKHPRASRFQRPWDTSTRIQRSPPTRKKVKKACFVVETKESMPSMNLRKIVDSKTECQEALREDRF